VDQLYIDGNKQLEGRTDAGEAKFSAAILRKNPNHISNLKDRGLTADKSGVVAANDDPGSCSEAPRVVDKSDRGRDGGGASSARVGPTNTDAFPASAFEVPTFDEAVVGVALVSPMPAMEECRPCQAEVQRR
jgi:hypothetical protein